MTNTRRGEFRENGKIALTPAGSPIFTALKTEITEMGYEYEEYNSYNDLNTYI